MASQPRALQQLELERLKQMNLQHQLNSGPEPSLEARINSFELAFRMQTAMPTAEDLSMSPPRPSSSTDLMNR